LLSFIWNSVSNFSAQSGNKQQKAIWYENRNSLSGNRLHFKKGTFAPPAPPNERQKETCSLLAPLSGISELQLIPSKCNVWKSLEEIANYFL